MSKRWTKPALLLVACSLFFGTLSAAARLVATETEELATWTIPPGTDGEEVHYVATNGSADWMETLFIDGRAGMLDARAATHDAVRLDRLRTNGRPGDQFYVALDTGQAIRWDTHETDFRVRTTFGPAFPSSAELPFVGYVALRGRTVTLGDDLSEARLAFSGPWFGHNVTDVSIHAKALGTVGGDRALLVEAIGMEPDAPAAAPPLLRLSVWFGRSSLFPLRMDLDRMVGDQVSSLMTLGAIHVQTGGDPLALEVAPAGPGPRPIERPADRALWGDEGMQDFCYPLTEALGDLLAHDASYATWMHDHPDALLFSAQGYCEYESTWRLNFVDTDGTQCQMGVSRSPRMAYVYQLVSQAKGGTCTVQDQEGRVLPYFRHAWRPEDYPDRTISLAQATDLWRAVAAPTVAEGPLTEIWAPTSSMPSYPEPDAYAARNVTLSRTTAVSQPDAIDNGTAPLGGRGWRLESSLRLDIADVKLLTLNEDRYFLDGTVSEELHWLLWWLYPHAPATVQGFLPEPPAATVDPTAQPMDVVGAMPTAAIASALTFVVLALLYLLPLLRMAGTSFWGSLAGFSRIRPEAAAQQAVRARLVEFIEQDPGLSPPQLQRMVGCGWTTTVYHLRVLERANLVRSIIDGRHRRFFPAALGAQAQGPLATLKNARTKVAWNLLKRSPGLHRAELARAMGVTPPAVAWHLGRLQEAGLVGSDKLGRKVCYYAVDPPAASPDVS